MKTYLYLPAVCIYLLVPIIFFTLIPPDLCELAFDQIESVNFSQSRSAPPEGGDGFIDFPEEMGESYSGPLPWESDERFLETMGKYKFIKKMVAYRATLKDPLPGEGFNIELAANKLKGRIVRPGQVFSQNAALGPYTKEKGYRAGPTYAGGSVTTTVGGGVCKIASLLYNLAVLADLQVVQRSPHSMLVPYVPPGQDATVFYGVKDLVFKNNTQNLIIIWAERVDKTLYMAFYGFNIPPKVTWHHEMIKVVPTYTIYKRNKALKPGERKVVLEGLPGIVVNSWANVQYPDGSVKIVKRGRAFYSPCPYIVERNIR